MSSRELQIPGAFELTPTIHGDDRGHFHEWFTSCEFEDLTGHPLSLRQANMSVSKAGVIRGIHFADVPPGQAKYVVCPKGAVLDVVIDIRVGSPTLGQWDSVLLDDETHRAIYLAEGLGHAFMSLEDGSTVIYLCSEPYAPQREHGIDPMDRDIAIDWPSQGRDGAELTPILSPKDADAPSLREWQSAGGLPNLSQVSQYVGSLGRTLAPTE